MMRVRANNSMFEGANRYSKQRIYYEHVKSEKDKRSEILKPFDSRKEREREAEPT